MKKKYFISILAALFVCVTISVAQDAVALYKEGLQLKTDKKASEALQKFKQAIVLKSDYAEALYESGWCQNDLKLYTDAIRSFRAARPYMAKIPKLYFELGYAFEKNGQKDSAIENYQKCLELKPDYSLCFKQLGYLSYTDEEYEKAIGYFDRYEAIVKDNNTSINDYLYWYRKGFMYNALKNFSNAKTVLLKSEAIKNDYLNTYLELGFACSRQKQDEEAIAFYKKAMLVDKKSHIPYNGIAEIYRDNQKNMPEAMKWYQQALDINPSERKANFGMGYCLNSTTKYSEAIKYLETAIASEPTYTAAYVELGYSVYKLNRLEDALKNFDKALSLNPKNENARYYATLIHLDKKDKMKAQKMVDELNGLSSKYAADLQKKVNAL